MGMTQGAVVGPESPLTATDCEAKGKGGNELSTGAIPVKVDVKTEEGDTPNAGADAWQAAATATASTLLLELSDNATALLFISGGRSNQTRTLVELDARTAEASKPSRRLIL